MLVAVYLIAHGLVVEIDFVLAYNNVSVLRAFIVVRTSLDHVDGRRHTWQTTLFLDSMQVYLALGLVDYKHWFWRVDVLNHIVLHNYHFVARSTVVGRLSQVFG